MKVKLLFGEHRVCGEGYEVFIYKKGDVFEIKDSEFPFLKDKVIEIRVDDPLTEEEKLLDAIPLDRLNVSYTIRAKLKAAGYDTINKVAESSVEDLSRIGGIGQKTAEKVLDDARKAVRE